MDISKVSQVTFETSRLISSDQETLNALPSHRKSSESLNSFKVTIKYSISLDEI